MVGARNSSRSKRAWWSPRAAALAAALILLLGPALAPASLAGRGASWPPDAWRRGDLDELSLHELAMLLAGVRPGTADANRLAEDLELLEGLPPVYADVASITLKGLARAAWHQEAAQRSLMADERWLLARADPAQPVSPNLQAALDKLDHAHLIQALAALDAAGADTLDALHRHHQPLGVTAALAKHLQAVPAVPQPLLPSATSSAVIELVAEATGLQLTSGERALAARELDRAPPEALAALAAVLRALIPFTDGAPISADSDLLRLAAAVDAARPIFETWSASMTALHLRDATAAPSMRIPDPGAAVPPLRIGLGTQQAQPSAAAPPLAEALRAIASAFGDDATAARADELAAPVAAALDPAQQQAVARFFAAGARHTHASRDAVATMPPAALAWDPGLLEAWADDAAAGRLPDPWSLSGQTLREATQYLQVNLEAANALDELLAAAEALVPAFTAPESSPAAAPAPLPAPPSATAPASHPAGPLPGTPADAPQASACDDPTVPRKLTVAGYLSLDLCGGSSTWSATEAAVLVLDTGGDDLYSGSFGSAPFKLPYAGGSVPALRSPIAVVIDLGGSDTYDALGAPCSQGAACADHGLDEACTEAVVCGDQGGQDSSISPVAVLVDWDGNGAKVSNQFLAGHRSQGYGSESNSHMQYSPTTATAQTVQESLRALGKRSYGILVERVGVGASVESTYVAGNQSQGSSVHANDAGVTEPTESVARHSQGMLVRLVGAESDARGEFVAGRYSQAAVWGGSHQGSLGLLFNVAGPNATSHDRYAAGLASQAAMLGAALGLGVSGTQMALFADVAGPGASSNDSYEALAGSRGFADPAILQASGAAPVRVLFLDALAPDLPDTHASATVLAPGTIEVALRANRGSSDDTYSSLGGASGWGAGGAYFRDIGGDDSYPSDASSGVGNNATWNRPPDRLAAIDALAGGMDSNDTEDRDGDWVPAGMETLFGTQDTDALAPLPLVPGILLDLGLGAESPVPQRPYAFVLDVAGDETYGPGFSATVHLDLGGDDTYLGQVAAAGRVPGPLQPPARNPLLSFLLDVRGDDAYLSEHGGTQGLGAENATGILLDLQGNDRYRAPTHAQGIGVHGGIGVLVDLHDAAGEPEVNLFWLDVAPGQGHGDAEGGRGILAATGSHNTFSREERVTETHAFNTSKETDPIDRTTGQDILPGKVELPGPASGVRVNLGSNAVPRIDTWTSSIPPEGAQAGTEYEFAASASDDDGDALLFCWTFEHDGGSDLRCPPRLEGEGGAAVSYAWRDVATNARALDDTAERVAYSVTLTVTDPGGDSDVGSEAVHVANPPPALLDGGILRGPAIQRAGAPAAYQVPFVMRDDMHEVRTRADWGDGAVTETGPTAVDWALEALGATFRLPDRAGAAPAIGRPFADGMHRAVDGNNGTAAFLRFDPSISDPPMQATLEFAGVRQVRQVVLNASLGPSSPRDVLLSVEGIKADGGLVTLGLLPIKQKAPVPVALELLDYPQLRGLLLRQVLPADHGPEDAYQIRLYSVQALGPGAVHSWPAPGTYLMDLDVLNDNGGANGTGGQVAVTGSQAGATDSFPLRLLDIAGRGPVRHASLAVLTNYTLKLGSVAALPDDRACVAWDSADPAATICRPVPNGSPGQPASLTFQGLQWNPDRAGDHPLQVTYFTGVASQPPIEAELAMAHVEIAFDLAANGQPLLFLALEQSGTRTWHEGRPALAIVDASGDDRYISRVAASRPLDLDQSVDPDQSVVLPALVVDAQGDDDYLSAEGMTQAFAAFGGVALLLDAAGDDRYVADGMSQGAAHHGAAALVDLGGDDAFNPVPPDDPAVRGGYASNQTAWTSRSPALDGRRPLPQPPSATLMQGAAIEGIGLLVTQGGFDSFNAADQSQGYGAHRATQQAEYVLPDPNCSLGSGGQADVAGVFCLLGIENVRTGITNENGLTVEPAYYTELGEFGEGGDKEHLLCTNGPGNPVPISECDDPGGRPRTTGLEMFLASGPRYGPGVGILVNRNSVAMHAARQHSQGGADEAGRGLLLAFESSALSSADAHSQAYSRGGTAAFVAGGPAVLWVGERGQAAFDAAESSPEGNATAPASIALLAAAGLRHDCGMACGGSDPARELVVDPGDLPAPQVEVEHEVTSNTGLEPIRVTVRLEPLPGLEALPFEVMAASQARVPQLGGCTGAALGPAVAMLRSQEDGDFELMVDPEARLDGGRGPLHPAGCTEINVFARQVLGESGVTPWGTGQTSFTFLPAPRVVKVMPAAVSARPASEARFDVDLLEPLAATGAGRPDIRFRLGEDLPRNPLQVVWDGPRASVVLSTDGLAAGFHAVAVQVRWPGQDWGDWSEPIAGLTIVDGVTVDTHTGLAPFWKLSEPLRLAGQATLADAAAAETFLVRAVTPQGHAIRLLPASAASCPGGVPQPVLAACALVEVTSATTLQWEADLQFQTEGQAIADGTTTIWTGGPVVLEVAVAVPGLPFEWQPIGESSLDGQAPEILTVGTPAGKAASNSAGPILLRATTSDGGACGCVPSGVDVSSMSLAAVMRNAGSTQLVPLARQPVPAEGAGQTVDFVWDLEANIPEGQYEILATVADQAGNDRLYNPGFAFVVDRTPPSIAQDRVQVLLPNMAIPQGPVRQAELKPLDDVAVSLPAFDRWWLEGAQVRIKGTDTGQPLAADPALLSEPNREQTFTGTFRVPNQIPNGASALVLELVLDDLAGNQRVLEVGSYGFQAERFLVDGLEMRPRSDGLAYEWSLDREVHANASIETPEGVRFAPVVAAGPLRQSVDFAGLDEASPHDVTLTFWDNAGWTRTLHLTDHTLGIPVGLEVAFVEVPDQTVSGLVEIRGRILNPPPIGQALLRIGGPDGPVAAQRDLRVEPGTGQIGFTLAWDTRLTVPSGTEARPIPLTLEYTDGGIRRLAAATVRVDNTPPELDPWIEGSPATNGWYAGAIRLHAGASDDTGPLRQSALLNGKPAGQMGAVLVAEDGIHEIQFEVLDGALPPNVAAATTQVRVDRTLPSLSAKVPLPGNATNQLSIPLQVAASDAGSQLDAYRVTNATGWTPWNATAPASSRLAEGPDGERWISVEVRDQAGNVRHQDVSLTLDRMAPKLVKAQWVGWTASDAPALYIFAQDLLNGTGRAAGVAAVRFAAANATEWADWISSGGNEVHPVLLAREGGAIRMQLRDHAGNVGTAEAIAAPPPRIADEPSQPPADATQAHPIQDAAVFPAEGTSETMFAFSAIVHPLGGLDPDAVWLTAGGLRFPMHPAGPVLEGGGRLYTTSTQLGATRFHEPHTFQVAAMYAGEEVALGPIPGPFVAAVGDTFGKASGETGRLDIPAFPALLGALALPALARVHARMVRRNP